MANDSLSSQRYVDDYFSSLLLDTQVDSNNEEHGEPVLRFARVEPGYELRVFWNGPLTRAQQLCSDFILLSCLSKVSGKRLRQSMLDSISSVSRS